MQTLPSLQELKRQLQETMDRARERRLESFSLKNLAGLALVPLWTEALAEAVGFAEDAPLPKFLQSATAAGWCRRASDKGGDAYFWMPDSARPEVLEILLEKVQSEDLRDWVASLGEKILAAQPEEIAMNGALRRWALLARQAGTHMADWFLDEIHRLAAHNNTAEIQDWLETVRLLVPVFGGRLAQALEMAERRLELAYRHHQDRRYLDHFLPREKQIEAFHQLMEGPDHLWALHYIGVGGVGKTMLLRHINTALAERLGLASARVDFDHLSPSYPVDRPGELLLALAEELRPYLDHEKALFLFRELRDQVLTFHERMDRQSGGISPAELEAHSGFQRLVSLFVDLLHSLGRRPLLILDTCEELAKFQPSGGPGPNVAATFAILTSLQKRFPHLRVIFAGRRLLARAGFEWRVGQGGREGRGDHLAQSRPQLRLHQLRGFDEGECDRFFRVIRKLKLSRAMERAIHSRSLETEASMNLVEAAAGEPQKRRFNPFDLSLYAEWVAAEPGLKPGDISQGRHDPYIHQRIVSRIENEPVRKLLPAVVLLRRFDRAMLACAFEQVPQDFDDLFRELGDQEWVQYQADDFLQVDPTLLKRLQRYFWCDPQKAGMLAARGRLARGLAERTRALPLREIRLDLVEAALRLLWPLDRPAGAGLWRHLERLILREGAWQWAANVSARLLGADFAGEGNPLAAAICATQQAAFLHLQDLEPSFESWLQVYREAGDHPLPETAHELRNRALAGMGATMAPQHLPNAGRGVHPSGGTLILASVPIPGWPGETDWLDGFCAAARNHFLTVPSGGSEAFREGWLQITAAFWAACNHLLELGRRDPGIDLKPLFSLLDEWYQHWNVKPDQKRPESPMEIILDKAYLLNLGRRDPGIDPKPLFSLLDEWYEHWNVKPDQKTPWLPMEIVLDKVSKTMPRTLALLPLRLFACGFALRGNWRPASDCFKTLLFGLSQTGKRAEATLFLGWRQADFPKTETLRDWLWIVPPFALERTDLAEIAAGLRETLEQPIRDPVQSSFYALFLMGQMRGKTLNYVDFGSFEVDLDLYSEAMIYRRPSALDLAGRYHPPRLFQALTEACISLGDPERAFQILDRVSEQATRAGDDPRTVNEATAALFRVFWHMRDFGRSLSHLGSLIQEPQVEKVAQALPMVMVIPAHFEPDWLLRLPIERPHPLLLHAWWQVIMSREPSNHSTWGEEVLATFAEVCPQDFENGDPFLMFSLRLDRYEARLCKEKQSVVKPSEAQKSSETPKWPPFNLDSWLKSYPYEGQNGLRLWLRHRFLGLGVEPTILGSEHRREGLVYPVLEEGCFLATKLPDRAARLFETCLEEHWVTGWDRFRAAIAGTIAAIRAGDKFLADRLVNQCLEVYRQWRPESRHRETLPSWSSLVKVIKYPADFDPLELGVLKPWFERMIGCLIWRREPSGGPLTQSWRGRWVPGEPLSHELDLPLLKPKAVEDAARPRNTMMRGGSMARPSAAKADGGYSTSVDLGLAEENQNPKKELEKLEKNRLDMQESWFPKDEIESESESRRRLARQMVERLDDPTLKTVVRLISRTMPIPDGVDGMEAWLRIIWEPSRMTSLIWLLFHFAPKSDWGRVLCAGRWLHAQSWSGTDAPLRSEPAAEILLEIKPRFTFRPRVEERLPVRLRLITSSEERVFEGETPGGQSYREAARSSGFDRNLPLPAPLSADGGQHAVSQLCIQTDLAVQQWAWEALPLCPAEAGEPLLSRLRPYRRIRGRHGRKRSWARRALFMVAGSQWQRDLAEGWRDFGTGFSYLTERDPYEKSFFSQFPGRVFGIMGIDLENSEIDGPQLYRILAEIPREKFLKILLGFPHQTGGPDRLEQRIQNRSQTVLNLFDDLREHKRLKPLLLRLFYACGEGLTRVFHLVGHSVETEAGLRFQPAGMETPQTKASTKRDGLLLEIEDIAESCAEVGLVIIQGTPVAYAGYRYETDRHAMAGLRAFAATVMLRGADAALVLPPLPSFMIGEVLPLLGEILSRELFPSRSELLEAVDRIRQRIVTMDVSRSKQSDPERDRETLSEMAMDVCLFFRENPAKENK